MENKENDFKNEKGELNPERQVITRKSVSNSGKSLITDIVLINEKGEKKRLKSRQESLQNKDRPNTFLGEEKLPAEDFVDEFQVWENQVKENKETQEAKIKREQETQEKNNQKEHLQELAKQADKEKVGKLFTLITSLNPHEHSGAETNETAIESEIVELLAALGFTDVHFKDCSLYINNEDFALGCEDDEYGCMTSHDGYENLKTLFGVEGKQKIGF